MSKETSRNTPVSREDMTILGGVEDRTCCEEVKNCFLSLSDLELRVSLFSASVLNFLGIAHQRRSAEGQDRRTCSCDQSIYELA